LTIQQFRDEPEAVALANDSEYGLSASVWTRDVDRSMRVARALDAGSVWVNDWAKVYDETEEGGFKQSGLGAAQEGCAADHEVQQARDHGGEQERINKGERQTAVERERGP
jgi:betaine-aldehyde dehydrogenase